jgi:hypothetical protein
MCVAAADMRQDVDERPGPRVSVRRSGETIVPRQSARSATARRLARMDLHLHHGQAVRCRATRTDRTASLITMVCPLTISRCQVVDFNGPITDDSLSPAWKDRLEKSAAGDPAVRDRDYKLLAWLEYAEMLMEGECCVIIFARSSIRTNEPELTDDCSPSRAAGCPTPSHRPTRGGRRLPAPAAFVRDAHVPARRRRRGYSPLGGQRRERRERWQRRIKPWRCGPKSRTP